MSKKTDLGKILYPESLSVADRRHCRRIIVAIRDELWCDHVIVACSGGIDSTVLVHALGQATRINPWPGGCISAINPDLIKLDDNKIKTTAVYLNHHLRPNEVSEEVQHVEKITKEHLSYVTPSVNLDVKKGPSLQERARDARYEALEQLASKVPSDRSYYVINIFTAHNMNDVAETKLFQFIKGRKVNGIPKKRLLNKDASAARKIFLMRPFLQFSREDIERYARCFNLTWCEDSSNKSDHYTRNKIRHHLIPWIKENINPGVINTLGRDEME